MRKNHILAMAQPAVQCGAAILGCVRRTEALRHHLARCKELLERDFYLRMTRKSGRQGNVLAYFEPVMYSLRKIVFFAIWALRGLYA